MKVSKLKEMFDDGSLHTDFMERYGCKAFEPVDSIDGVVVFSKEAARGPKKVGKGSWVLTRVGIAETPDADRDNTLYMSTFTEGVPERGTPVTVSGIEYSERDDGSTSRANLTFKGIKAIGETIAPAESSYSQRKDRRIYTAGCMNTAIAIVALKSQAGILKLESAADVNTAIAATMSEVMTENPF